MNQLNDVRKYELTSSILLGVEIKVEVYRLNNGNEINKEQLMEKYATFYINGV